MHFFKKFIIFSAILSFLFVPSFVLAGKYGLETAAQKANLTDSKILGGAQNPFEVMGKIVSAGLSLIGFIFFGLMLFAGIVWMTARGDTAKVDKAKDVLESAIIGLIIVIAAYAIVNFVFDVLLK